VQERLSVQREAAAENNSTQYTLTEHEEEKIGEMSIRQQVELVLNFAAEHGRPQDFFPRGRALFS